MDENLFNIILLLIPVIGSVITYFVVPYLKTVINNENLKQYKEWTTLTVKCAEMLFPERNMGENKKEYVINFLNNMFNKNKVVITEKQIEVLVEACVKELRLQQNN